MAYSKKNGHKQAEVSINDTITFERNSFSKIHELKTVAGLEGIPGIHGSPFQSSLHTTVADPGGVLGVPWNPPFWTDSYIASIAV